MADTVWVVRHGQRQDSVDPAWRDHADRVHDPPLTDLGRWAAWRVGRRFTESDIDLDAVYASPFLRTAETAEEICRETGTEALLEPGLGEHRNPEWFDADPDIVPQADLAEWFEPISLAHDPYLVPEYPETAEEAMARTGTVARQLVADTTGTLLIVGHGLTVGGVVDGLVGSTDGVDAPICGLTRLDRDRGQWHLAFSGDTSHLDA